MLVGVGDAAVVFFLEGVFGGIGIGIAALPELLDELLAFFVGLEMQEGVALFGGDDVDDVFVEPLLILGIEFVIQIFVSFGALLGGLFRGLLVWLGLRVALGDSPCAEALGARHKCAR